MSVTLACYLLRKDGEWYELGNVPQWRLTFGVFPGPPDGSVVLTSKDTSVLALRLDGYGHDAIICERLAADIIQWADGKSFKFVTELDPEIELDVKPSPITGSFVSDLAATS